MNRPHFRRHPRPVDPNPEYSRLDRLDGLPRRASGGVVTADGVHILAALGERIYPLDELHTRTRYDAEWPSLPPVFVPRSFVDLPADQSGFTGWGWGEGYEIETEERAVEQPAHHPRHAWTSTPPVDEADVEALAGLVDEAGVRVVANASSRLIARRLLATGRVSVTP